MRVHGLFPYGDKKDQNSCKQKKRPFHLGYSLSGCHEDQICLSCCSNRSFSDCHIRYAPIQDVRQGHHGYPGDSYSKQPPIHDGISLYVLGITVLIARKSARQTWQTAYQASKL